MSIAMLRSLLVGFQMFDYEMPFFVYFQALLLLVQLLQIHNRLVYLVSWTFLDRFPSFIGTGEIQTCLHEEKVGQHNGLISRPSSWFSQPTEFDKFDLRLRRKSVILSAQYGRHLRFRQCLHSNFNLALLVGRLLAAFEIHLSYWIRPLPMGWILKVLLLFVQMTLIKWSVIIGYLSLGHSRI